MIKHILLSPPIHYKLMNGSEMKFDCLAVEYLDNGKTEVNLSVLRGCGLHNEIRISANMNNVPEGYLAVRTLAKSSPIIIPALVKRGILEEHPTGKCIEEAFTTYPLYKICTPIPQAQDYLVKINAG